MLENLELIGTGFAVVMTVLAMIWGACALMGSVFIRAASAKARAEAAAVASAPVPAAQPSAPAGIPPQHLAAIAAAVAHTLGAGYRVTRVDAPAHKVNDWPLEGRIENFTAHRVRTNWGPTRPTLGGRTPNILRGQNP